MIATLPAPFVQPDIRPLPSPWWRPSYVLAETYVAEWTAQDGRRMRATAPQGLRLDGSTEWLLTAFLGLLPLGGLIALLFRLGPDGSHRGGVVIHDWLYGRGGAVPYEVRVGREWHTMRDGRTRDEADWAMRALSIDGGMPAPLAIPRWLGVRMLGRTWWRSREKDTA